MEIKYMKLLQEHPVKYPNDPDFQYPNEPMPMSDIVDLEKKYNSGKPFPLALREFLLLAGNECIVLDWYLKTLDAYQVRVRELLDNFGITPTRPFFAFASHNGATWSHIVYLDEGDNPKVRNAYADEKPDDEEANFSTEFHNKTLSEFIDNLLYHQVINP